MKMVACVHAVVLPFLLATANGLGCHLHSFNVTLKSDRQGTCRGIQTLQACVGFCESSAFPSKYSVLVASGFQHNVTSVSQCCTIAKMQKVGVVSRREPRRCGSRWPPKGHAAEPHFCLTERHHQSPPDRWPSSLNVLFFFLPQVKVRLRCGESWRETMELFTAKACQCDMCRLSRY
uniref:Glycoprotein hormone subunit alpha 2 n=2 Tax=Anolis carolinensis TaxID=28377 RepID=H9GRI1_ANOCA